MKLIVFLTPILLISGCNAKRTDESKKHLAMKTHCVGHNLIDLPDDYVLAPGSLGIFVADQRTLDDTSIDVVFQGKVDQEAFTSQVHQRQVELASVDHGGRDKLTLSQDVPDGGMLFRVRQIDDAYESEVHWRLQDQYLIAKIDSYNNQFKSAEELLLKFKDNIVSFQSGSDRRDHFCLGGWRSMANIVQSQQALVLRVLKRRIFPSRWTSIRTGKMLRSLYCSVWVVRIPC